ncbi:hypothetical protein VTO73DRAFT_13428 [Trametes versicolor]
MASCKLLRPRMDACLVQCRPSTASAFRQLISIISVPYVQGSKYCELRAVDMGSSAAASSPTSFINPSLQCPPVAHSTATTEFKGCVLTPVEPTTSNNPNVGPFPSATVTPTSAATTATNNPPQGPANTITSSPSATESAIPSTAVPSTAATNVSANGISSMGSSSVVPSNSTSTSLSSSSPNGTTLNTTFTASMFTSSKAAFDISSTQSYGASTLQYPTNGSGPGSSTTGVETFTGAQSSATSTLAFPSKHSNHTGAIVGGVIGSLAFLLLATVATILLRRRMRARHTAPSAEFMGLARGTTPGPGGLGIVRTTGTMTPSGDRLLSLARQKSPGDDDDDDDDDDDRPPAFTPGAYADPVLEKVQVAAAMREQFKPRDSYYGGTQTDDREGTSDMGHEGESTQVGTEEDYGSGGDEKSGYYTWAM